MNPRTPSAPATPPRLPADIFQRAFENSPAMQSIVRAADGLLIEVNNTFLVKLGFTREQVIGRTAQSLGFWVDPDAPRSYREDLERHGSIRGREVRLRGAEGSILTILLSTQVVRIAEDTYFVSAGVDITERQRVQAELRVAHERLRQSEERFSKAFHANPTMVVLTRLTDRTIVAANDAFLQLTGYTEAEVLGRTTHELGLYARPEARDIFFQHLAAQGSVRNYEHLLRTKEGGLRTLLISAEVVDVDDVPHLAVVGVDISERMAAEAKLRESETRLRDSEATLRALYEGISAAVVVHDESGFLQTNQAALRLFGARTAGEFLGKHPPDFSAPTQADGTESGAAAQRHMARALAEGRASFEWLGRKLDGTVFPLEVTLTPLKLGGRTVFQAVTTDLTERKRAEVELQKALAQERELSRLKTDFVSLVSHEFRTPLEIIMSSADNLDRYHDRLTPVKRQQLLRTINKSVRRMADMMEEVLLLGRMDSNRVEFRPVGLDLAAFCRRLRDEMDAATAGRCPIQLETKKLPANARGDESVIRHILTNLIGNAVKYSPAGATVKIEVTRVKSSAVFRIVDSGCGIPAADQSRLFQAFHRAANVRHVAGTGLGLVIVQRCVALHGGRIAVESVEGAGTTVTVTLPLFATAKTKAAA